MPDRDVVNGKPRRERAQLLDRRILLIGMAASLSSAALAADNPPRLIILPKGATSPARFNMRSPKDPRKVITVMNMSLEGFLVCNGAAISRTDYKELFQVIGTRYGTGDGKSTFGLPKYALQYRAGHLVAGMAMSPSNRLTLPVSIVVPFDAHDLIPADPS